jgi:mannose-1-phosphate guanylyltransferase
MESAARETRLWSVVLAGGDGQRMSPLVQRWLGCPKAKQYCTFVGTRSMFQHTLDRADMLTPPEQRVTVAAGTHRKEVFAQLKFRRPGTLVFQPANRDTAAGVFLALAYVRARDPRAFVVIFPSDHFIFPDHTFIETVRSAVLALDTWRNRVILLGSVPDHPETDYGWILSGAELGWSNGRPVRAVRSFVEKPHAVSARQMMAEGGLWNTLVLVARLETLWSLGAQCFPRVVSLFERLQTAIAANQDSGLLEEVYRAMPRYNFSSDLLARVAGQIAVMELRDVVWSDWGRPERVADVLSSLGKQPKFPLEHLRAS